MRKLITAVCLLLSLHVDAQTKIGRWYRTDVDGYIPYKYKVRFYKISSGFATEYKITNPRITITAKHDTVDKQITVLVEETDGGVFAKQNQEQVECEPHALAAFGIEGNWRALGGSKIPHQLALKYLSKKYDYVNVISVQGHTTTFGTEFFVFN